MTNNGLAVMPPQTQQTQVAVPIQQIPMKEMERMAHAFASSGLFGVKNLEQALALMLVAQAEGLHPATAARDYHIISGRPSLKADAMMARFQSAGGSVEWLEYTDQKVSARFSHPSGGSVVVDWDEARVKAAGLGGGNHAKFPRQMKRARVISEGIRTVCPGVLGGFYTPEEVAEFEPVKSAPPASAAAPRTRPTDPETQEQNRREAEAAKQRAAEAAKAAAPAPMPNVQQGSAEDPPCRILSRGQIAEELIVTNITLKGQGTNYPFLGISFDKLSGGSGSAAYFDLAKAAGLLADAAGEVVTYRGNIMAKIGLCQGGGDPFNFIEDLQPVLEADEPTGEQQ